MSKGKSKAPVVMSKAKLILPKMEFIELDSATGEGMYVRELGGKALLEYREKIKDKNAEDLSTLQSIEMMADLVLRTSCNEDGSPYFSKEEVDQLADTSLVKLQALAFFAMEVSGISTPIHEATENLKNDQASSSTES